MTLFSTLHRHDFARLRPDWREYLLSPLAETEHGLVADWIAQDRPLVVARRQTDDANGTARLGLALPDRRRIGLHVGADAISVMAPPPLLRDALMPPEWRLSLFALVDLFAGAGVAARIYGSLAWQTLTGLDYVRPDRSDVDLLFAPADAVALTRLAGLLHPLAGHHHPRLDGEIVLPGGLAVSWREWLIGGTILVKAPATVFLADASALIARMPGRAA